MAEQLLNGAEVGAFFKQMSAKGMTQRVRMNVRGKPAKDSDAFDDASDAAGGEPSLTAFFETTQLQIEEERRRAPGRWRFLLFCSSAAARRAARSAK